MNVKVASPGPATGEGSSVPISATTPEWSIESSHGPCEDVPAIQIEPGAVRLAWACLPTLPSRPLSKVRPEELIVTGDPLFFDRRVQIIALAARHAVPTIYPVREMAVAAILPVHIIRSASTSHLSSRE